jgi:hypothetical protein
MGRTKPILLVLCALMFGACGHADPDVAGIEGEYFADDNTRTAFRVQGEQARQLAKLVTNLESTEHLKWPGAAVFTITYADGTKREVSVCKASAVLIDGKAYKADANAILAIIQSNIDQVGP